MATHSSVLAWRIPGTEEPGGLLSMGSHRVGHDWSNAAAAAIVSNSFPPHGLYSPGNSPGQNTEVGSLSFLQGIVPTQGLNPGLPHCRWILYQLSHKGSSNPKNSWQRTSALRQKNLSWGGVPWQPWVLSIKYFQSFFMPYGRICFRLEVRCGMWFLWTVKSDACDNPWKSQR